MASYNVVFDIAEAGYKSASFPATGLLLVAIGIAWVIGQRYLVKTSESWSRRSWMAPYLYLGFAVLWTATTFHSTFQEFRYLSNALESGNVHVVEGVVSNFNPMPFGGHAMESFCVRDECFKYSDFEVTAGFNNTSSHGGPIREGIPVRVTYVRNDIVRLEVMR